MKNKIIQAKPVNKIVTLIYGIVQLNATDYLRTGIVAEFGTTESHGLQNAVSFGFTIKLYCTGAYITCYITISYLM